MWLKGTCYEQQDTPFSSRTQKLFQAEYKTVDQILQQNDAPIALITQEIPSILGTLYQKQDTDQINISYYKSLYQTLVHTLVVL